MISLYCLKCQHNPNPAYNYINIKNDLYIYLYFILTWEHQLCGSAILFRRWLGRRTSSAWRRWRRRTISSSHVPTEKITGDGKDQDEQYRRHRYHKHVTHPSTSALPTICQTLHTQINIDIFNNSKENYRIIVWILLSKRRFSFPTTNHEF